MEIRENYSYITELQKAIVNKGLGQYCIRSINLTCGNNDVEKLKTLCDTIDNNFLMYQYRKNEKGEYICSYKDKWDIFHWGGDGIAKLSFNGNKTIKERMLDGEALLKLLKEYNNENISVVVQYSIELDEAETIDKMAEKNFKENENKFITRSGIEGKIKKVNKYYKDSYYGYGCNYGFFKKGSKGKYYQITNAEIAAM